MYTESNRGSELHILDETSKNIVKLPVNIDNGAFWCETTKISDDILISGGLYQARNKFSFMEVINYSQDKQKLCLDTELQVEKYTENDYIEVNAISQVSSNELKDKVDILTQLRTDHLNTEELSALKNLCKKFPKLFHQEGKNLTFTNVVKHKIQTTDEIPLHTKPFRYSPVERQEIQRQINKLLDQDIIRHSHSPWSAPIFLVSKKPDAANNKKWRLVIDYRKLNEKTIKDKYPMPNITDVLDRIGRAKYFTALDLASGYHQVEMDPRDVNKTAFSAIGGHFEFVRMPFGLSNAPATFQRVMDNILADLNGNCCLIYLDDIIVFSSSLQEHVSDLKLVFDRLNKANLKLQPEKSEFFRKEIEYLGHVVTESGIKPNPKKLIAIKSFPIPKTRKQIKAFLGLLGYYRKFINDFAAITKPLTQQLKGKATVVIDEEYRKTFETCKTLLCNDPILQFPDFTKSFILTTDASNFAIGAVLSQGTLNHDKPVSFASRTLSDTEINYSTVEKEMLAIIWATKHFRPYLYGQKFKIVTDHRPLTWLMNFKEPNSKLVRWKLQLLEYDYEVIYKKGSQNVVADALSRVTDDVNISHVISPTNNNISSSIPISNKPLNEFNEQIIFKIGTQAVISNTLLFKNKMRRMVSEKQYDKDRITKILKKILKPHKTCAIFAPDEIFKTIEEALKEYFLPTQLYKVIR